VHCVRFTTHVCCASYDYHPTSFLSRPSSHLRDPRLVVLTPLTALFPSSRPPHGGADAGIRGGLPGVRSRRCHRRWQRRLRTPGRPPRIPASAPPCGGRDDGNSAVKGVSTTRRGSRRWEEGRERKEVGW